MSAPFPLSTSNPHVHRAGLLAGACAALTTGAVAVTVVLGGASGETARQAPAAGGPATAEPDAATLYHRSLGPPTGDGTSERARRAAERFHHFR